MYSNNYALKIMYYALKKSSAFCLLSFVFSYLCCTEIMKLIIQNNRDMKTTYPKKLVVSVVLVILSVLQITVTASQITPPTRVLITI